MAENKTISPGAAWQKVVGIKSEDPRPFSKLRLRHKAEVQSWPDTISNLSAAKHRREAYRKAYNVEENIRALEGVLNFV